MVMMPTSLSSLSTTGIAVNSYFLNILATSSWSISVCRDTTLLCIISPITASGSLRSRYLRPTVPTSVLLLSST